MKNAIYLIFIAFLVGCDTPPPEKKLKQILVFESRVVSGKEVDPRMIEKKIYNQKGLPTSVLHYDADGKVESQNTYEYDQKGQEVMDFDQLDGKLSYICKTTYDKRDSVTKYILYKPNKTLDFTIHVKYDKAGFNFKDVCINAEGSVNFYDEFTYDQTGNQKQWIRYNPDSTVQSKVVYEYNNKNQDTKHICSGELGGTYSFKYNKKGLKSEERAWNTDDKQFLWLKVFSYDESDRITKITEYNSLKDYPKNPYKTVHYEYKFW